MKRRINNTAVEYTDFDFNKLTDEEIREFGRSIARDNVIIVRNQNLHEKDILRVCETIGTVLKPNQFFMHPDYPGLFRVTNERKEGKKIGIFADKELDWHSNGNARPSGKECCVSLYCVRPGINSVTSFCDTRQAYKDLPEDIKEIVNDIDCTFMFKNNTFYHLDPDDRELRMFDNSKIYPKGVTKSLVYSHPYDTDKGLYFSFHYITKMWRRDGSELDEQGLREYLMNHVFQEKYMYHHDTWTPGDFIFMDQFHSIHKRNEVQGDRFLYRLSFDYENCYEVINHE